MPYNLINYKSNYFDKQCWTVLDQLSGLTPMYAMIYSSLVLNKKASSTQQRRMTAICQFYRYILIKHNDSFDSFFELNGLRSAINELHGFSSYLDIGQRGVNIVSFGAGANSIDVSTSRIRINDVIKFLQFLNQHYTSLKYCNTLTAKKVGFEQTSISFLLKNTREDLTSSGSKRGAASIQAEYKSLTPFQCSAFLKIIRPSTPVKLNEFNPFSSSRVSFRNYLICTLALEYGLRRGELNLLETDSFKPSLYNLNGVTSYYLVVTNCDDEEEKAEGSIKTETSHRTLKITKLHYDYLCAYVKNYRLEPDQACDSSILFLSTQSPKALSLRMINKIFACLTKALHQHFPEFIIDPKSMEYLRSLFPHLLRHTWAVAQLYHMVDELKMSITDAKDLLRVNGGWSINSDMPDHYGRRFLADKANAANLRHILKGEK
jgi:integrase